MPWCVERFKRSNRGTAKELATSAFSVAPRAESVFLQTSLFRYLLNGGTGEG